MSSVHPLWVTLILFGASPFFSENKPAPMPKTDPEIEIKLVAKTEEYKVPTEWRGGKLKEKLAADAFPATPKVDLELEIINKGKTEKSIQLESDAGRILLELKGPGAVSAAARRMFTQEYRTGKLVSIKPGEKHTIAIKQLSYGFRGVETSAYWTEPGDYTLSAKLIVPADTKEMAKPEKLEWASNEIKLKVLAE